MKTVVTGGAGFIGSHLTRALLNQGREVVIADDFSRGNRLNLSDLGIQTDCQEVDLRDFVQALEVTRGAETVFHLAARVGSLDWLHGRNTAELEALQTNLLIDTNTFRACIQNGVKKIVYASSCAVYPMDKQYSPGAVFSEDDLDLKCLFACTQETQPTIMTSDLGPRTSDFGLRTINPDGGYGWAKLLGELQLSWMREGKETLDLGHRTSDSGHRTSDSGHRTSDSGHRTSDLGHRTSDFGPRTSDIGHRTSDSGHRTSDLGHRTIKIGIARIFNIYGENGALGETAQVVPALISKAIRYPKEEFIVWGDGKQSRDFLYVSDCVDALLTLEQKISNLNESQSNLYKSPLSRPRTSELGPRTSDLGLRTSDLGPQTLTINIGSDKAVLIGELAEKIVELSGKNMEVKYDTTKPMGPISRTADITKAKTLLNWYPKISLNEGLKRTYTWVEKRLRT
jgi:nucleoside-diphosphate-sugar epimerase